jgi:hypothetical protein
VRIREIETTDRNATAVLLAEGFPRRSVGYWEQAFDKLASQDVPPNQPRFGFVLVENSEIVGILLNIWTPAATLPAGQMRANLSSWYVKPQFRGFAAMLLAKASRHAGVTYLNVSAAPHTIPTCEALGFKRYTEGQAVCVPILSRQEKVNKLYRYGTAGPAVPADMAKMMSTHVELGCAGFYGVDGDRIVPFLFTRRAIKGWIPAWQLIYCPQIKDFQLFAQAIGRQMLRSGVFFVICNSDGAVNNVPSKYFPGKVPKYYKGPDRPNPSDLSFTEIPLFGI